MKKYGVGIFLMIVVSAVFVLSGSVLGAQDGGATPERMRSAYRMILSATDKNGDGKLSMAECMSVSTDKNKIEKDCRYWDANGDGVITEEEYVKQAGRAMTR